MEKEIIIYSLSDPLTFDVRYIGKTNNLKARYAQHCCPILDKGDKDIWVYCLQTQGLKPVMTELERCEESLSNEREIYQIKKHLDNGCDLFNKNLIAGKLSKFSFVLPDGAIGKLKEMAKNKNVTISDLVLEFIEFGLSGCQLVATISGKDLIVPFNRKGGA